MNSKAIKRQLLAAIAMVLVAALALGSSTYAWFVASGTVTATGMKVTAQSEGGLAISYGGTAWATTASAEMSSAKQLFPASTRDLATWVHATATAPNSYAAAAKDYTNVTGQVFNEGSGTPKTLFKDNNYVVMKEFLVRSTATDTASLSKGLFVKDIAVTITKNSNEVAAEKRLSTALRVGVQCGSNSYIFGPVTVSTESGATSPTNNYQVYNADGTANGEPVALATKGQTSVLVARTETITNATSGVPVYIYIWFEGEDHELFSDNMYLENLNVSVEFQSFSSLSA